MSDPMRPMLNGARFIVGDVFDVLATLPDASVDLVLTSPPFLALRSYLPADHADKVLEIGSEATPGEFIDRLLDVVEACARVLAPHGSMCFELGDTYSGSGGAGGDYGNQGLREGQPKFLGSNGRRNRPADVAAGLLAPTKRPGPQGRDSIDGWPLDKSLCLIPESFRFSLVYGFNPLTGRQTPRWRARNVIRWCRPNPPVGALGDKVRPATSDMVVICKDRNRYFDLDAVRKPKPRVNERYVGRRRSHEGDMNRPDEGANPQNEGGSPPLDHWWHDDVFDQDAWLFSTQAYPGAHYACVDEDTEALTPRGWRRHDELEDYDLIAAYDADTDQICWQPAKFVRYEVADIEMVQIDKEQTSQHLTLEHRMLIRSRKRPEPFVKLASDISSGYDLMLTAPWKQPANPDGPGPAMAALLGWVIADGSCPQSSRQVVIYQSALANAAHCAAIRQLLEESGAKFTERERTRAGGFGGTHVERSWTVSGPVADWIRSFPHKQIPFEAILAWPDTDTRALFEALVDGDGSRRADGRIQFVQKNRDTADMFQALAMRLGYRAVVKRRGTVHTVYVGTNRWVTLRGADGWKAPIPRGRYTGTVWCPQVPTTFWLARRDGKPFITGNTWPEDLCVIPIKAMCPLRVCTLCGKPSERITEVATSGVGFTRDRGNPRARTASGADELHDAQSRRTVGWTDCGCGGPWRAGLVLDPFAGSGTTLQVATGHGRDAIGIDLDERNAQLALDRVGPLLLNVEQHRVVENVITTGDIL